MNISLPDTLKSFVDEQVGARGFGTSSEYVRELIRKDQERQHLRNLLLDGPIDHVNQIVVHLARPLTIGCVDEVRATDTRK